MLSGFEFEPFEPDAAVVAGATVFAAVPTVPAGAVPAAVVPTTELEPTAVVCVPDEPPVADAPLGSVSVSAVTATPPCVHACSYSAG